MIDYMEQERINSEDLAEETSSKLIICLCIDTSYSMIQEQKIDNVNQSIEKFIKKIQTNMYARDTVDLGIITFGAGGVRVEQEFSSVSKISFKKLVPDGGTPMGEAIRKAVGMISDERKKWSEYGVMTYRPWLIIISDGEAEDKEEVRDAEYEVKKMLNSGKLKTKCIGMGDGSEKSDLARFSRDQNIDSYTALEIDDFFDWLSRSATGLSTTSPEEDQVDFIG